MMPRRPANDDPGAWIYYWRRVGQGWRREPEIGPERQRILSGLIDNAAVVSTEKRFPFEGVILHRGDVEWIVAEWPGQQLDLRGAVQRWRDLLGIESAFLVLPILDAASHVEPSIGLKLEPTTVTSKELKDSPSYTFVQGLDDIRSGENVESQADSPIPLERDPKARRLLDAYGQGERNFAGWDLVGAILKSAFLRDAILTRADLEDADLSNADLSNAVLKYANLSDANISFANLTSANLLGAKLVGAKLCSAVMRNSHLKDADFDWANLANAQLQGSHWDGAHWGHAKWPGSVWNDPSEVRPLSYESARPISSEDYIGEWWSRDRDS